MMAHTAPSGNPEPEASTPLVSRGSDGDGDRRRKPWCDHCEKPWQTRETCWKIHGKPTHMKKSDSCAFQSQFDDSQENIVNSKVALLTKEQIKQLYKIFKSPQFYVSPSCSLAHQGNPSIIALSSVTPNSHSSWIIDSGATDHMTSCSKLFFSNNPCAGNRKIKVADSSFLAIVGMGSIKISHSLTLHNVLRCPKLIL